MIKNYRINTDENNYVIGILDEWSYENVPLDMESYEYANDYINAYKVNETHDGLLLDEDKLKILQEAKKSQEIMNEVAELKRQLDETDYKINKSTEYLFAKFKEVFGIDFDFPYDMELLNQQRQELRDRINELEN